MSILFDKQTLVLVPVADRVYSDINRDYMLEPIDTVVDGDSLTQKILFVLGTPLGTRKWRPQFGCRAGMRLFDPFDKDTARWIKSDIIEALEDENNGLTDDVTNVKCVVEMGSNQTYIVTVGWTEPKLNKPNKTSFYLRA
jgi:hypothetical protein